MAARKKPAGPPDLRDDARVCELVGCVLFARNNFPDRLVIDPATDAAESLHGWFERAIEAAGFKLADGRAT
jgi:hypothetical protein